MFNAFRDTSYSKSCGDGYKELKKEIDDMSMDELYLSIVDSILYVYKYIYIYIQVSIVYMFNVLYIIDCVGDGTSSSIISNIGIIIFFQPVKFNYFFTIF